MQIKTVLTARYSETDQMGIIHHSIYAIWFEAGRTDFLKSVGVSNTSIEKNGVLLPLYEFNCKFMAPTKYEDEIMVITTLKNITCTRISFSYRIKNVLNSKMIAMGETKHAWTNKMLKPINAQKIIPDVFSILIKNKEESDLL